MRQVVVLAGLLGVALVGAYLSWTHEVEEGAAEGVPLYRASQGEIEKVVFTDAEREVVVERRRDAVGDYTWVTVSEQVEVKPEPSEEVAPDADTDAGDDTDADTDAGDAPAPEPKKELRVESFTGNETATEVLDGFAPLVALRKLPVPDYQRQPFGLGEGEGATLTVTRKGEAIALRVGGETYGAKDRYVEKDGELYLVGKDTLRPLDLAKTRMKQRALVDASESDARRITVVAPTPVELEVRNADDADKRFWSIVGSEAENAPAKGWVAKLLRTRLTEYAPDADLTGAKPVLRYTVAAEKGSWSVEWVEVADGTIYAKSTLTRVPVKIDARLAKDVIDDLGTVAEGGESDEDAAPTPE